MGVVCRSDGTEEITKVGIVKKNKASNKWKSSNDSKDVVTEKPRETFRAQDGALITNYEVGYADEPEEDDKLNYAGGIKGIRALRRQRDNLPDVEPSSSSHLSYQNSQSNNSMNSKYEEESKRWILSMMWLASVLSASYWLITVILMKRRWKMGKQVVWFLKSELSLNINKCTFKINCSTNYNISIGSNSSFINLHLLIHIPLISLIYSCKALFSSGQG